MTGQISSGPIGDHGWLTTSEPNEDTVFNGYLYDSNGILVGGPFALTRLDMDRLSRDRTIVQEGEVLFLSEEVHASPAELAAKAKFAIRYNEVGVIFTEEELREMVGSESHLMTRSTRRINHKDLGWRVWVRRSKVESQLVTVPSSV